MSRTATYSTTVHWKGEHWGHLVMGNGPEMDFSAPPDAHGYADVFTPEDAFVAAANTCVRSGAQNAVERPSGPRRSDVDLGLRGVECRSGS